MSPLHITILLHYHTRASDYAWHIATADPDHARSEAVREFIEYFVEVGVLSCRIDDIPFAARDSVRHYAVPLFEITEKGSALVEHLCAVQIPVCKWIQPEGQAA